ncbi:MAG: YeeE/YedE family protein [Gemmatimonadota bacterium]|nr:YeeE/YedE family protein [Gemmatimonadota bacterium]
MTQLMLLLSQPWPWYVAGPMIGLFVPVLLLVGNRSFGISSNLRHLCAVMLPGRSDYLRYDWREAGGWNLAFAAGIVIGGAMAARFLMSSDIIAIAPSTHDALRALGLHDMTGSVPRELFSWSALVTPRGVLAMVGGGFLVGFGTAYAGGCTSGHAISGLANLQLPSVIAVVGFFVGGLVSAWFVVPLLLGGLR